MIQLWDVPYAELTGPHASSALRDASAICLVADLSNWDSLQAVDRWREYLLASRPAHGTPPLFLLFSKRDTIKDREGKREVERAMKSRTR